MNIKDIANICGVSVSTVSKVLHDDKSISAETKKKVQQVIREYHYIPYSQVLQKMPSRMNLIAVVMSKSDDFENELLRRIRKEAGKYGYDVMISDGETEESRVRNLYRLQNKGINGFITFSQKIPDHIRLPQVVITEVQKASAEERTAFICYDIADMGYQAVKFLLKKGHKNIACYVNEDGRTAKTGYQRAYEEAFIPPRREWMFYWEEERADEAAALCIQTGVTAVICADAQLYSSVYRLFSEKGIRIPEQMSVLCIGTHPLAEQMIPKISAIEVSAEKLACYAVKALTGMMEEKKPGYSYYAEVKSEISERESVFHPENQQGESIVVVGNMNMDYNLLVDCMPETGETLRIRNTMLFSGGKGGNQAVGAGKLGKRVFMVGCLGNDKEGREIYDCLLKAGVQMEGVTFCPSVPTGKAYIMIGVDGESTIIIYDGANEKLNRQYVQCYEYLLADAKFCLITTEIPEDAIACAIELCFEKQVQVIVKPSAAERIEESLLHKIDYFVPNEKEAARLVPGDYTVEERAEILFDRGVKNVIITLGSKGCYLKNRDYAMFFDAVEFQAVDVTGAADAFISALAAALCDGKDILCGIRLAAYAAGFSVTRFGVQQAMIDQAGMETYAQSVI